MNTKMLKSNNYEDLGWIHTVMYAYVCFYTINCCCCYCWAPFLSPLVCFGPPYEYTIVVRIFIFFVENIICTVFRFFSNLFEAKQKISETIQLPFKIVLSNFVVVGLFVLLIFCSMDGIY